MGCDLRHEDGCKAKGGGEKLHRKMILENERPELTCCVINEDDFQHNFSSSVINTPAHRVVAMPRHEEAPFAEMSQEIWDMLNPR